MIFDKQTLEQHPQIKDLFPKHGLPASASFNGPLPAHLCQRTNINSPASVKLALDKPALFDKLAREKFPVPKYYDIASFFTPDGIAPSNVEAAFGPWETWADLPLRHRTESCETMLTDLADLIDEFKKVLLDESPDLGVLMQPSIRLPKTATLTAIPQAYGKKLRLNGQIIDNGVLTPVSGAMGTALKNTAREVIHDLGLSYGTVVMLYNEDGEIQIDDVHTRLNPSHSEALVSFIEILHQQIKTSKKK